ncbi:MINT protein, partial [Atractosteus spatula]|nr:MINT protein [Atractosteus spatula]
MVDDKSLSLKNLEIRLSVDDVKGVLRSSEDEPEPFEASPKKPKPALLKEEVLSPGYLKEVPELSPEKEEVMSDQEPPAAPAAALLARQMELEQAVENIAKLTEEPSLLPPYKEPPAEPPELPPMAEEPEGEVEGEKPANPASETELAAAIDSITAEDISADADGFPAPATYTAIIPTPEQLVLPPASEGMEPETHLAIKNILDPEPAMTSLLPATKRMETAPGEASTQEESSPPAEQPETPRKGKVKTKARKTPRARKGSTNRKGDPVEDHAPELEPSAAKPPEPAPEAAETEKPKAETATAAAATASCKQEGGRPGTGAVETPKEAEQPPVEQPEPRESAFHAGNKSPTPFKLQQPANLASPSHSPSPTKLNVTPSRPAKLPSSPVAAVPDWLGRSEDSGVLSPQVAVAAPAVAAVAVATPTAAPPLPPDTKASDIDPSSSTLRKILMEPKYVSAAGGGVVPSTVLTTSISDPLSSARVVEAEPALEASKPSPTEDKPSPATPQPSPLQPPPHSAPAAETQPFGEKVVNSVISSKATSVISRMPQAFDSEEAPRITLGTRAPSMSLPKHKFRASLNDNSRYHMGPSGLVGGEEGRPVVESAPFSTGSSPGLRVNTSEGVVVLSYSGQKTEGPQRISAKISQIPPASAVDIEFQQSVSKSQIKQEPVTPSQVPTPKGSQTPSVYGAPHSAGVLAGQPYGTQPVISSIKQESPGAGSDKADAPYLSGSQGSAVKLLSQSGSPQVLVYGQMAIMQQAGKKGAGSEAVSLKVESGKPAQPSTLSPGLSPHHPSLAGNHVGSSPSTPTDRALPHLGGVKQEPHSPRTSGHSPSPYPKVCQPSSSAASVVLGAGMTVPQYVSSVHHPEQSVIMPPHSVTSTVSLSHLSQGEVRMNTPPLPGMGYGMRPESMSSPRSGLQQQRSSTPQPAGLRDMVLQPIPAGEEDLRPYRRPSAPQLQPEVMVMQQDHRLPYSGLRLDPYNMPRDVRILMHHQIGEHGAPEGRQSRTPEAASSSSSSSSSSAPTSSTKTPPASKTPQPGKDTSKPVEVKLAPSPHSESRILGVHPSGLSQLSQPVMVPHGVQLMHPAAGSFTEYPSVYRDIRNFHSQFPGINLAPRSVTPSQGLLDGDHGHPSQPMRSKTPQVTSGGDPKTASGPESTHLRHTGAMDLPSHLPRVQGEAASPSYPSPVSISMKHDLPPTPGQKTPQGSQQPFLSTPPPAPPGQPLAKERPHRPVDMVQLLTKYPIVWQGHLALKNDTAAVQLHFVSGNNVLAHRSLPAPEGGQLLRIVQRMRLEASQLEGVARRMTVESDYCLLLAMPCGRDQEDMVNQTASLKSGFITYLQAKQAAGIINVPNPGSNQPAYVLQIFPPCEFSESHLSRLAPDLLAHVSSISPHLMIVIASV